MICKIWGLYLKFWKLILDQSWIQELGGLKFEFWKLIKPQQEVATRFFPSPSSPSLVSFSPCPSVTRDHFLWPAPTMELRWLLLPPSVSLSSVLPVSSLFSSLALSLSLSLALSLIDVQVNCEQASPAT